MNWQALALAARQVGLTLNGGLHPPAGSMDAAELPKDTQTVILLGPDGPRFWPVFSASAEYTDGVADPMDRWSKRVVSVLASKMGGSALFPSDGPPYPPFISWALNSGAAWAAPVGLLVHETAGLLVSYRGAIALPYRVALPPPAVSPCGSCPRPCETACPVGAMAPGQDYDVAACQAFVRADGRCRSGCLLRHACPVSQTFARATEQDSFHMAAFLGE